MNTIIGYTSKIQIIVEEIHTSEINWVIKSKKTLCMRTTSYYKKQVNINEYIRFIKYYFHTIDSFSMFIILKVLSCIWWKLYSSL